MTRRPLPILVALAVFAGLLGSCAGGTSGGSTSPSPGASLGTVDLRYALIARFGAPWFCDPDQFPVGRDEQAQALERWPEVQRDETILDTIAAHLGTAAGAFTDRQKLEIYREWKRLNAIVLDPVGDGRFRFDQRFVPRSGDRQGMHVVGLVGPDGGIEIERQEPAGEPICPICLDAAAPIETPDGPIRVDALAIGRAVWSVDAAGHRVRATVLEVRSVDAPRGHQLVHLVLADGRRLLASPGHPLADGRPIGTLEVGAVVDGSAVVSVARVESGPRTWDLLPTGPTGIYLVDGIPLRSTLAP